MEYDGHCAFKFKIYPNSKQRQQMDTTMRAVAKVWNLGLELRDAHYELHRDDPRTDVDVRLGRGEFAKVDMTNAHEVLHLKSSKKSLSSIDTCAVLVKWKKQLPWLAEAPSSSLQQALRNLDQAYKNAFRRLKLGEEPGFPKYKSVKHGSSFKVTAGGRKGHDGKVIVSTQSVRIKDEHHVILPKFGVVRCRGVQSELIDGRCGHILGATVSRLGSGAYYVSINCEHVERPEMPDGKVDVLGVRVAVNGITRSDGIEIDGVGARKKLERRLAREQRRLSRKKFGSRNYEKQRKRKAKLEERIANMRSDSIHKATKEIVRDAKAIAVGRPEVKRMSAKKKGEGRSVQKTQNRAMLDSAMYMTTWRLEYKAARYGRDTVILEGGLPWTRTCSACGAETGPTKPGVRRWTCESCGTTHDTATNAARNIMFEGAEEMASRGK